MHTEPHRSAPRLVAVLGCTGVVGTALMRELAAQGGAVRGLSRSPNRTLPVPVQDRPARVSYTVADVTDVARLARAMHGVDALFLATATGPEQVDVETRAIDAARTAGVRRIVKLSAPVVTAPASVEAARWHREIEAVLAASGLEHASLRPHAFMQNWLRQADVIQHTNTILGSAGTAPRNYVDARDVAAIAARLLSSEVPLSGATFAVSGPEAISNADMAVRLSYVTGTEVRYENLTRAGHERALVEQARLPAWLARHLVELEELAVLMPEPFTSTVPELLGTTPRTMDEFIHEHRLAFVSQAQPQQAQPQRARL